MRLPFAASRHDPCFGLRGLAGRQQVCILFSRMHLDREHFMCIEELQQQWKSAETPGQLSQKLFQQLSDSPSFEWSVGHLARMVVAVAEYPRLADRSARQRCRKQGSQMPAAPEPILIDRFESQGIQRHLINVVSPLACIQPAGRRHRPSRPSLEDCPGGEVRALARAQAHTKVGRTWL